MHDLRLAIRSLRATPIVTLVTVLSLALGVGASTALFSLINALMLRPLGVASPERLVALTGGIPRFPWVPALQGYNVATWAAVRDRTGEFEGSAAWFPQRLDLARGGEIQPVDTLFVSERYFQTLGVASVLGHVPGHDEERSAVLSYAFWQARFGGRADILGQQIFIESVALTVVGVTPQGFFGAEVGRTFDVAVPMQAVVSMNRGSLLNAMITRILLRLSVGQSLETATAQLRTMQPEIRRIVFPNVSNPGLDAPFTLIRADTGTSVLRDRFGRPMLVVFGVVTLVLIVACANLANLLMARSSARRHDLGVRRALGASRGRLIRLLMGESVILAAGGSLLGWMFANWGARTIASQLAPLRFFLDTQPDLRVLAFTAVVAVLTVFLFGLAPAFAGSRVDPIEALRSVNRTTSRTSSERLTGSLVSGQVTVSVVVVFVAALLAHSFINAARMPLGFDADRLLLVTVNTQHADVAVARRSQIVSDIADALRTLPDVDAAGMSTLTPSSGISVVAFVAKAAGGDRPESERVVATNAITPGWIATYGMSLRAGRDFTPADMQGDAAIVLVNEAFAGRFMRNPADVGETIPLEDGARVVVGIVSDAVYNSLKEAPPPTIYLPLRRPASTATISLRARGQRPTELIPAVRGMIEKINSGVSFSAKPLAEQIDSSLVQDRLIAQLSVGFSVVALLLSALGIYGVTAYGVARRRSEIAIRMALGCARAGIVRSVLGRLSILLAIGTTLGVALSLWAGAFLRSLLFGLQPRDPDTLIVSVAVLVVVAGLAASVPAWRAAGVDPAVVLREG